MATELGLLAFGFESCALRVDHIEVTTEPLLVTFVRESRRVARGKQCAIDCFALGGKRAEIGKGIFHIAEGVQNGVAVRGDGLFVTRFGGLEVGVVASALHGHVNARADRPEAAGGIEKRAKVGAGDTCRASELDGREEGSFGNADARR